MISHTHKYDLHRRIVSRLREQAADVRRLVSGLDEDSLARRTVPGKWSLKELVCHLWRVQLLFAGRIEAMLAQDNPRLAPYEPEGDVEFDQMVARPAAESLEQFLSDRERLATRLEALPPAGWRRPGVHPQYSSYDVHCAAEYMTYHEAHHMYQMLQRRAPLGPAPH